MAASEALYRQLIHSLPVAVSTCDTKGRIVLYNAAAVKLWGREPGPHQRWCAGARSFTPDGRLLRKSEFPIAVTIRGGNAVRGGEQIIERQDGSRAHVLAFPDSIRDQTGRITGGVNVLVDITALKDTEAALRAGAHQIRTLSQAVEQSPSSVLITTPTGEIDYVNRKFTEVTGYTLREALGKNPRILKSGAQPREFYKEMWDTITAGREWRGEFCNRKKNGELFWEFAVIAPVKGSAGEIQHFVAIKEDITERRRALENLRDREERLRAILNTVVDSVVTIDRHCVITDVNPATERMFGYTRAEMIGRNVKMLMPSPYREEHDGYIEHLHRTGQAKIIGIGREAQGRRKDGEIFPVELALSKIDHLELFTGVIRDITKRRELEEAVSEASEREQNRLGQDLHDGLCQHLLGIEFRLFGLKQKLQEKGDELTPEAEALAKSVRNAMEQTRNLAHSLSPLVSGPSGLIDALRGLANTTSETFDVTCSVNCPEPVQIANNFVATHLYRIAQEAVHNAIRHGKAKNISVNLFSQNDRIILEVKDDGVGFPKQSSEHGGIGLRVMQYRANVMGGSLTVQPEPEGGTTVICSLSAATRAKMDEDG